MENAIVAVLTFKCMMWRMSIWNASRLCSLYLLKLQISLFLLKNIHFQFLIEICECIAFFLLCWRQILWGVNVSTFISYGFCIFKLRPNLNWWPICLLKAWWNVFFNWAVSRFGPFNVFIFQNLILCVQLTFNLFIFVI